MAQPTYPWNPFQERVDCRIKGEVIKPAGAGNRVEFVPRAAPFYAHEFKLYRQGSTQELVPGVDFVFGHPFDRFIKGFNRNVYGSVVLLKPVETVVLSDYDTIGAPFVLDEGAFVELVANIINSPRTADWTDLSEVPTEFPALPHPHPAAQTYDYLQMLDYLKNFVQTVVDVTGTQQTVKDLLEEHMNDPLTMAHLADKGMLGLELVANIRKATMSDLQGNSDNVGITMAVLKEAFRRFQNNTLDLSGTGEAVFPPTHIYVADQVPQNSDGHKLRVEGGYAGDGSAVTYNLTQAGASRLTFSKITGIQEGEEVTFRAPTLSADSSVTISALAVDKDGIVSTPISTLVNIVAHKSPTVPTTIVAPTVTYKGALNVFQVGGSVASDGATLTYEITQSGPLVLTFAKTTGIFENERIEFMVPGGATVGGNVVISVVAKDSTGAVSEPLTHTVNVEITPTIPGSVFGGGYYMGRMTVDGESVALILGKKATAEFPIPLMDLSVASAWVARLEDGGFDDWVVPTWNMMDVIYRVAKPDSTPNAVTYDAPYNLPNGVNPESVPAGVQYTASVPGETTLAKFAVDGEEAFLLAGEYWTASTNTDDLYLTKRFDTGGSGNNGSDAENPIIAFVRAVRLHKL